MSALLAICKCLRSRVRSPYAVRDRRTGRKTDKRTGDQDTHCGLL